MAGPVRTRSAEEWRKAQAIGLPRFVAIGALRRGIPMALLVIAALEILEGGSFGRERVLSADFAVRVLFVFAVFLAGGAVSSWARWKSYESLHRRDSST